MLRNREDCTRENQAIFRPARGCIDHKSTVQQALEHKHTFRRPTTSIHLTAQFYGDKPYAEQPVREIPFQFLYSNSRSQVSACDDLRPELTTMSGFRHGCPPRLSLPLVIQMIMKIALFSCKNNGVEMNPGNCWTDNVMLTNEDPNKLQIFLTGMNDRIDILKFILQLQSMK